VFSDLVDRPGGELRTGNHVVQRGDTVLFVASPDSVRDLRDPASAVSRELAAATAPGRDLIVLRLPGVDDADCAPVDHGGRRLELPEPGHPVRSTRSRRRGHYRSTMCWKNWRSTHDGAGRPRAAADHTDRGQDSTNLAQGCVRP